MTETLFASVQRAQQLLQERGMDVHAAELAMRSVTGMSQANYLASFRDPISHEMDSQFWAIITELLTGKPIQYILGEESFYGYSFEVNEHVLIPRPETEELVHYALQRANQLFGDQVIHVADIGTGSGAIAVAFKKERPTAKVTATDFSESALEVAKRNAERNEADITFMQGDMEVPLKQQKWDIVLSNPPYIAEHEKSVMSPTVYEFEPQTALFAEEEGLYFYRRLAENLSPLMNRPALIGFEIGYQQGLIVQGYLQKSFPQATVEIIQDINKKDRMIFCEIQ
ncbi:MULTISPECIES: peptide chain release factor N(5)-glutamine methyltransferase [unclassified Sporosarcina]|uniref:peptide chain release factor N(5)-glutamine methyltransferase n=1 Tax=unclassified Sporosarcina TaxID=2647733 RepID=UPI000C1638B5|nr:MULTISPECIES: peptide chain release factor N(5)-glutamine methyltransferase [unclassified Sporosarcina]PID05276.1 protein-(glutamine-N5) methyltransferase, release factor-specific [Sporosarcina sp. P30]PID08394.1 protein-(glutamine-N5) methyltransferase, release factor-specific [Sporosarcina sp. P31]PID12277.1 protein-(glutamine-N5) methyltransferase, release factor-specific [Sporosarcina sp. P32b]